MSQDLIPLQNVNALEVFSTEGGLDPIIEKVKEQVRSEHYDISTEEGRKRIGSVAKKIGSTKVTLQNMALELTEDWRKKTKAVNSEKNRMTEELDALRDEIKAPLEEYREREKNRVDGHEQAIADINTATNFSAYDTLDPMPELIEDHLQQIDAIYNGREWEEFAQRAAEAHTSTKTLLEKMLESRKKRDAEQAELERLRREEEERKRKEEQERIAREAAEKARKEAEEKAAREREEAEAKAKAERERYEAEKREAEKQRIAAEEKAKRDAEEASKKAAADKEAALQAERDRIEAEKKAEAEAAAKREADKKHKAKINNEAVDSLMKHAALDEVEARAVVSCIAKGEVANVKIIY